jgi:hypothetical protein
VNISSLKCPSEINSGTFLQRREAVAPQKAVQDLSSAKYHLHSKCVIILCVAKRQNNERNKIFFHILLSLQHSLTVVLKSTLSEKTLKKTKLPKVQSHFVTSNSRETKFLLNRSRSLFPVARQSNRHFIRLLRTRQYRYSGFKRTSVEKNGAGIRRCQVTYLHGFARIAIFAHPLHFTLNTRVDTAHGGNALPVRISTGSIPGTVLFARWLASD